MNAGAAAPLTLDRLAARLAADPAGSGLLLDFDGTLAPLVDDPATSALPDGVAETVAELASRLGLVAVVSGRPIAFLAERAALPGVRLLGLYGLQEWADGRVRMRPEAARWQDAVDEARRRLASALRDAGAAAAGVALEDKGLSVALHWRNAADRERAAEVVQRLGATVAEATGLAREPGRLVEELRPPVAWDKGEAVRAVAAERRLRTLVYAGDDRGDLAAFAAVVRLGGVTMAVDQPGERVEEVCAAADLVVDGPPALARWLRQLRDALSRSSST